MTLSKIRVTKKSQFSFYKSLGGSDRLQKLFNIPKSSLELNNYEFVTKKNGFQNVSMKKTAIFGGNVLFFGVFLLQNKSRLEKKCSLYTLYGDF